MNDWMAEAERLARLRAPCIDDQHAHELADDLYKACSEFHSPAEAVRRFFAAMPPGWKALPTTATMH